MITNLMGASTKNDAFHMGYSKGISPIPDLPGQAPAPHEPSTLGDVQGLHGISGALLPRPGDLEPWHVAINR